MHLYEYIKSISILYAIACVYLCMCALFSPIVRLKKHHWDQLMPKLSKSFLNANYCNYNSVFVCILIFPSEQNFPEGSEVLGSFNWKSLEPRMESSLLGNVKAICTFLQGHAITQMNVRGQSPHSTSISARGHLCCAHILAAPHWRECCRCAPF